jgi:hypothetical protein
MSTDRKGTKILALTFFNQLRTGGYTSHQIIDIATELIDLVTTDLRDAEKIIPAQADPASTDVRPY